MTALYAEEVRAFAELFKGRTDAYGRASGTPRVLREPLLLGHYVAHLSGGGPGIGVYPMLDDDTVWFGAIDLDEPNFELAQTMQKLIPGASWIERSKSGNAHVWVFFAEPCPAWAVRAILRGATESVGRREVEVFPKQDTLRAGGLGNFINLPYHGDERPMIWWQENADRWSEFTLDAFIEDALGHRQDPDAWVRRARALGAQPPSEREAQSEFGTQPQLHMCAQHIIENRFENPLQPGSRAVVLFNLSRQLLNYRDFTVEEARYWVHEVNEAGTRPAPHREVERQFTNALNGEFTSTGCDDGPMAPYVHPDCPIANGTAGR